MPSYPRKQLQEKFPFSLIEHCPSFLHWFTGQLESKKKKKKSN